MEGAVDFVEVAQAEQDEEQGGLGDGDGHGGGGVGDAALSGKDGWRQQALDRAGGVGDKLKTIGGSQDLRREDRCAPTGDDDVVAADVVRKFGGAQVGGGGLQGEVSYFVQLRLRRRGEELVVERGSDRDEDAGWARHLVTLGEGAPELMDESGTGLKGQFDDLVI